MRFLARKQREEGSLEQPPPEVLSGDMTDEDSDYGPVPPPPPPPLTLSNDEDEENMMMMPGKSDPPQDVTHEMSMDHYQEEDTSYLQEQATSADEEDGVRHEYDDTADNQKYIDDDNSVEIPPTHVVQRMLSNEDEGDESEGEKSSRGAGCPLLIAAACCLCILAIVLGTGFGTGAFLRKKNESARVGLSGNEGGAMSSADTERLNKVSTLLLTKSKDQEVLRDGSSAENQAMTWLATKDPAQLNPETDPQRLVQRYVLASLYYQSDSKAPWTYADGWLETIDECQWFGVSCEAVVDASTGTTFHAVTILALPQNGLSGGLPVDLALLTNLKSLDLSENAITQDIGAIDLTGLTLLQDLHIQGNAFAGEIPNALGTLPLRRLYLGDNAWTEGPIPVFLYTMAQLEVLSLPRAKRNSSIPGAIGSLVNLKVLDVAENALTGTLPEQLLGLGTITELTAPTNQLIGALPDFTGWKSLVSLDLAGNKVTGTLPDNLGDLAATLQLLQLSRNAISGTIPDSTTGLVNLQVLDVSRNRMTGQLPSDLSGLASLRELNLNANLVPDISGFTGPLPDSLGNLKRLERLEMRSNAFSGVIPAALSGLDALTHLDLRFNGLTGTIPAELSSLADTVKEAYFQGSRLEGIMPSGICGVAVLETDCSMECSCCTMECTQQQ